MVNLLRALNKSTKVLYTATYLPVLTVQIYNLNIINEELFTKKSLKNSLVTFRGNYLIIST
jgi:hypothetical protein